MEERIKQIMANYGLTAGSFAEILGIQASAISHIINGRNNPSLEFVKKVLAKFPDITFEWLVLGKGSMNTLEKNNIEEPSLFDNQQPKEPIQANLNEEKPIVKEEIIAKKAQIPATKEEISELKPEVNTDKTPDYQNNSMNKKRISRIIVFYTDETYEEISKN
ncbi:MAG: helix-turn-helix domain-containing protein [Bacteroidales bacterium]|jgi:transcriptional regulator with XRE-family HTH domain|nr:helix-turn-helix domain-containing protein [Bacteroidales bacterium]